MPKSNSIFSSGFEDKWGNIKMSYYCLSELWIWMFVFFIGFLSKVLFKFEAIKFYLKVSFQGRVILN